MTNPRSASDYETRIGRAVYTVMLELGQVLGAYIDDVVVIGGVVPWLLINNSEDPHVGTADIDLALDSSALEVDERYAQMIELLEQSGFERQQEGLHVFQMRRMVPVENGDPIPVILDFLKPAKPKVQGGKPPRLAKFRVIDAVGAEFALRNPRRVPLEGVMPDGRHNRVELSVTDFPAFLVMKGHALMGRDKPKDAYDIYYVCKHYTDGHDALADSCRPLLTEAIALQGFKAIRDKFRQQHGFGPDTVRDFLRTSTTDVDSDFVHRDAFAQVNAFITALQLPDDT